MKLRTRKSSLRLRLSRAEVATLAARGALEERVDVSANTALVYRLVASEGADAIRVELDGTRITVELPAALARAWASSDDVGLSALQPIADRDALSILIEKDFACVKPRVGEDETDNFPHPDAASGVC